eukprot:1184561-Prorocentrum_minimum.AAC.3
MVVVVVVVVKGGAARSAGLLLRVTGPYRRRPGGRLRGNTGDFPEDVSKPDCMGKPTVARWLGAAGKSVLRRGEAGFWRRALCPR